MDLRRLNEKLRVLELISEMLVFLVIFIYLPYKCVNIPRDDKRLEKCALEKSLVFSGVVSAIVADTANPPAKIIYLTNGTKAYSYSEIWEKVGVNDSIVKIEGHLIYKIYYKEGLQRELIIDHDVFCR